MPHIEVHATPLPEKFCIQNLLHELHDVFSREEDGVRARIKTHAVQIQHCVVGAPETTPQNMIHVILKVKAGRSTDVLARMAQNLHKAARAFLADQGSSYTVTVEVQELNPATYCV